MFTTKNMSTKNVFTDMQNPELNLPDGIEMQRLEASLNACLNIGGTFHPSTIQVRQYKRLTTSKQSSWDEPEEVNC